MISSFSMMFRMRFAMRASGPRTVVVLRMLSMSDLVIALVSTMAMMKVRRKTMAPTIRAVRLLNAS